MLRDTDPSSFPAIYRLRQNRYALWHRFAFSYHREPLSLIVVRAENLIPFCGKKVNKIKGPIGEYDDFLLLTKRLETGRFPWPRKLAKAKQLSPLQFDWLIQGFPIDPIMNITHPDRSA